MTKGGDAFLRSPPSLFSVCRRPQRRGTPSTSKAMNNAKNTTLFPYLERLLEGEEVEWKTLGEVAEIGTGSSNRQDESENGLYPFYVRSKNILRSSTYQFDETAIIIPGEGGIGDIFHYTEGKYALHQRAYRIKVNTENELFPKFLFYYMTKAFKPFILARCVGATATSIRKPMLADFPIPVPPLRIQARIVEILDKFTQLEKELEAELEARKKQYAYYRDQLLNFLQYPPLNVNIEWRTLGEVMEIVTDFTAAGSFASNAQNVRYLQEPNYALLVRTTDIKQGFKSTEKFIYVDQHAFEYLWRVNLDKECIILPNVGNCGEVYHSSPSILPYTKCVLGPNTILVRSEKVSNKFLFYLFQAAYFQKELAKITSTAGQGKFNKTNLKQIKLPIPPLSEQRRIVDILDRFDTLTNSISEGLPKEIALRRKQYEYYRDALLNFPRAEVTA